VAVGRRPTHAVFDRYLPKGHPDQDRTEKALEEIGHVAMAINEGIRDKENEGKVGDLCLLNTTPTKDPLNPPVQLYRRVEYLLSFHQSTPPNSHQSISFFGVPTPPSC
jgi:hypothetical protein